LAKLLPFLPLFDQIAEAEESPQPAPAGPPPPPESLLPEPPPPVDAQARSDALDIHRSFVVEAPAGSGKTGLLIQRFLKLLADESVTSPEQVLAMTFTIKATAELRDKVLAQLHAAAKDTPAHSPFDRQTRALAEAVIERDRLLCWNLRDHPRLLNIRTIGSVCADIAARLPVLSGSGGRLAPTEDPEPLYREAARRTLLLLGSDPALDHALRDLLLHRDGNLANCESLIASMLDPREQWGSLIPRTPAQLADAWLDANVLPSLELALDRAICTTLAQLTQLFPADALADLTALAAELGSLDGYDGNPSRIAHCAGLNHPPQPVSAHLDHWRALIHLLVTAGNAWRKRFNSNDLGFDCSPIQKARLKSLIEHINHRTDILEILCRIRSLPPAHYPPDQWAVTKSLFRVLSRALIELQIVFSQRGECDYTEPTLLARAALTADRGPEDLAIALGANLQHLLVDEMQDTSSIQYEIVELLTQSWDGRSQTVFLVGDPKQSIYLFRQARVERFIRVLQTQRLGDLPLTALRLTANFRSQGALVDQFNLDFERIFADASPHSVPYTHADAILPPSAHSTGLHWHAHLLPDAPAFIPSSSTEVPAASPVRKQQARRDAREIRKIALQWLDKELPEDRRRLPDGQPEPWRLAVLVSNRAHLDEIVVALKSTDEPSRAIPFRAIEIDALNQCQEVLDLAALTRALLHPADRVAWLALLRAPWCGLSLADLHALTGADEPELKRHSISRLIAERSHLLSEEGSLRLARIHSTLQAAVAQRAHLTLAQLVERTWRSLGGDAWLGEPERINARRFLELLDTLEGPGGYIDPGLFEERLRKLYAKPDPISPGTSYVELLTIHKAKGLEWDVVIVPALEGKPAVNRSNMLSWEEIDANQVDPDGDNNDIAGRAASVMLAPIPGKGQESHALHRWLKGIHRDREAAERKRLFYVACTRAREELHLFAAPATKANGEPSVPPGSLLQAAWLAAKLQFPSHVALQPATSSTAPEPAVFDIAATAVPLASILQRLPLAFDPTACFAAARSAKLPYGESSGAADPSQSQFARPEGSFAARSFGNVVHACLEVFSTRIAEGDTPERLLAELPTWVPRVTAMLRAGGLPRATVDRLAREALSSLKNVLHDPDGLWLLAPHPCAASELAITAWPESRDASSLPASVRVDRVFHAGPEPHTPGEDSLWILDYKTAAHSGSSSEEFLAAQRVAYGPQLELYARILAPIRSKSPGEVRLALYFPTLPRLIWWKAAPPQSAG
jgi:ATP-dependent exoDNAse (exonuclease V) beta subunit